MYDRHVAIYRTVALRSDCVNKGYRTYHYYSNSSDSTHTVISHKVMVSKKLTIANCNICVNTQQLIIKKVTYLTYTSLNHDKPSRYHNYVTTRLPLSMKTHTMKETQQTHTNKSDILLYILSTLYIHHYTLIKSFTINIYIYNIIPFYIPSIRSLYM